MTKLAPAYNTMVLYQDAIPHHVLPVSNFDQYIINWAKEHSLKQELMLKMYDDGLPLYGHISFGKREGTIGKIDYSKFVVKNYIPRLIEDMVTVYEDNHVVLSHPDNDFALKTMGYSLTFKRFFAEMDHVFLKFDDRRPVKVKGDEFEDALKLVLFYDGPTTYEILVPDPLDISVAAVEPSLPKDRFGKTIEIGDTFFYAGDELVVGKLMKISDKYIITYRDVLTGEERRIQNEMTKLNLRQMMSDSKFLRFEKDEMLSRTIMFHKLTL